MAEKHFYLCSGSYTSIPKLKKHLFSDGFISNPCVLSDYLATSHVAFLSEGHTYLLLIVEGVRGNVCKELVPPKSLSVRDPQERVLSICEKAGIVRGKSTRFIYNKQVPYKLKKNN